MTPRNALKGKTKSLMLDTTGVVSALGPVKTERVVRGIDISIHVVEQRKINRSTVTPILNRPG